MLFSMPIQQRLTPPVLLISAFAGWVLKVEFNPLSAMEEYIRPLLETFVWLIPLSSA